MAKSSRIVQTAADALDRQIRTGRLGAGSFLPSESALATSLGVSRATVRRAIEQLAASGAIVRRPYSRPVIAGPQISLNLGNEVHVWVSHPIADEKSLVLVKEISKGLRGGNYRLVVREPSLFVGSVVNSDERDFLTHLLESSNVAGAIIERDPYGKNEDLFAKVVESGKHLVFVDTPPPDGIEADFVGTSNVVAARSAVNYLQSLGHTRIWMLADCDIPPAIQNRIRGYWRGMKLAGLESMGRVILSTELPQLENASGPLTGPFAAPIKKSDYFSQMAFRIALEIQRSDPLPSAIVVAYDVLAFWVCAFLDGMGISVPRDIAVVGFDWFAKWEKSAPDILTTVAQDFEGFGIHASNLLLDRLNGEVPKQPRHVLLDAPIVVKSSTSLDQPLPSLEAAMSLRQLSAN